MATSRLLLADDSVTIQKVVNLTFSGEGIDVVCVSDGNSAIDLLREEVPDLVMADVNIPGVNGYEICEMVKSMDTTREIPVILLVGSFEPFDEEEAKRVGADGHLTKPFESIAALVDLVNGFLEGTGEAEQPRFDDTVEYPPDHEMVLSASSIPFAGGFEDETIETEQVSSATQESAAEDEKVFRPVEGLETFGGDADPEPESYAREDGPAEFDTDLDSDEEPQAAEEEASYYFSDTTDEQESEPVFAEHSGSEDDPAAEQAPVEYGSWKESEPADDDGAAEEFAPEDDSGTEDVSEVYYREESYRESSYIESSYEAGVPESVHEAEEEDSFSPIPLGSGNEEETPVEFGAMTVELDESDLLELPVDLSNPEPDSHEGTHGDPFEQTMRDDSFRPRQFADTEESGRESGAAFSGGISEELVNEIARRVVERLSEKAVREIAWEVVPEMAELIIKKMTEQKLNE